MVVAGAVALATAVGRDDPVVAADPPASPGASRPTEVAPVNVFLNAPGDLDALWKALKRPDFVILSGDEYARLRASARPASEPAAVAPWAAVVEAVAIRGVVRDELARLEIDLRVHVASDAPTWASLQLDQLPLVGAREGDRDLAVRTATSGAREVELTGRGRHEVRVLTVVPVRPTAEGRRIELAIPEAASTRFQVDVPQRVVGAQAGPGEPLPVAPRKDEGLTRIAADVSPRSNLAIAWRVDEDPANALPPLLVAQGEIALDVDTGSLRARSSWSIRSNRGTARSLQLTLAPDEEVLELELDGQTPPAGMERAGNATRLTIPLTEPLSPGQERHLTMSTRRRITPGGEGRLLFAGFPLTSARDQAGAIGISQGEGSWVSAVAVQGVRQIDPRTELPADLRARPSTALAFQFTEQPFQLELSVDPSPPQVRAEGRHTVIIEPTLARCDTWLDYQATRGRVYEVQAAVPPGFEIESVGPEEVVASWQTVSTAATRPSTPDLAGLQFLTVRLSPRGQDTGRFSIHIAGRQPLLTGREPGVGLVRPLGAVAGGGRLVVLNDPSLTVELNEPADGSGVFRPMVQALPSDWPWPGARPASNTPVLGLRYFQAPAILPLRIASHPRTLAEDTSLSLRPGARDIDVVQETELAVRFGSIDRLDVEVPSVLQGRWEVESTNVMSRTEVRTPSRGGRVYRLALAAEVNRTIRLRFRYRLPFPKAPVAGRPIEVGVPSIRLVDATPGPTPLRARVEGPTTLGVSLAGTGWSPALNASDGPAGMLQATQTTPGEPLRLQIEARSLVALPRMIIARLGLQTTQLPEGRQQISAWLRVETPGRELMFTLPPGSDLERVRVDGQALELIERIDANGSYRAALPAAGDSGRRTVHIEYSQKATIGSTAWMPPRFGPDAVVQESVWDVHLPWTRALVGVPAGWTDANEWYWDWYVWKRRPVPAVRDLAAWVDGRLAPAATARDTVAGDDHSYAFSRPGEPEVLAVMIVARAWLVTIASGIVLLAGGLLFLVWRPSLSLAWSAASVLVLGVSAIWHPSVVLLAVQSSVVGVALTLLLALIQRVVDRRRHAATVLPDARLATPPGSTVNLTIGAGADDSTAIRTRPVAVSTLDFVPASGGLGPPVDPHGSTATRPPSPTVPEGGAP